MKKHDIEVAIADDHALVRESFAKVINSMDEFCVSIQAANGKELMKKLEEAVALPAILLLDISMPVMDGYKTMACMNEKYPAVKVLALSMYESEYSIIQMFRLGARGYLEKGRDSEELRQALMEVYEGSYYYSDTLSGKMLYRITNGMSDTGITPKELEFLSYCCTELTYKEIAAKMGLSPRTIDGYRDSLCEKLDVKGRTGLVIYALHEGIVTGNTLGH